MTLTRYVSRLLLARFLTAVIALGGLAGLLDLIDNIHLVLDRRGEAVDLLIYLGYRLPNILIGVFPLATLIAAIFSFMGLALHQEIVALRSAGATFARLVRAALPAAVLLGGAYSLLWNIVAPRAEIALNGWLGPPEPGADEKPQSHWIRLGSILLSFEGVSGQGTELANVMIYERKPDANLLRWQKAERAVYLSGDTWRLDGVRVLLADGTDAGSGTMKWNTPLRPRDVLLAALPTTQGAVAQPRRTQPLGWIGANSQAYYATRAQVSVAIVLVPIIMICLTLPAATTAGRSGGTAGRVGLALGLGLAYVLVDGLLRTFGEAGVLLPFVAAWSGSLLFLLVGATTLLHIQD